MFHGVVTSLDEWLREAIVWKGARFGYSQVCLLLLYLCNFPRSTSWV